MLQLNIAKETPREHLMVSGNAMFQTHILDLFYPTTIPSRLATVDLGKKELSVSKNRSTSYFGFQL